jgi:hypothetical protein
MRRRLRGDEVGVAEASREMKTDDSKGKEERAL